MIRLMETAAALARGVGGEAALAERWAAGVDGVLRLEDGRALRVVFPGVAAGGSGPDFTGAILDLDGDLVRGDVEVHLRASGWRAHGHARDAAYAEVALHVVAVNDDPWAVTRTAGGRAIPLLVLAPAPAGQAPLFVPPCALAIRRGTDATPALARLGERRLRMKAARASLLLARGPGPALYTLALETLGGSGNREAFASVAQRLPLAALLETAAGEPCHARARVFAAHLRGTAGGVVLRRAGLRPLAAPGRRLDLAGALVAQLWPGSEPCWPAVLRPGAPLLRLLGAAGVGRSLAVELAVNAILPVALASGAWTEDETLAAWAALPSPGTYGRLRRLERWLTPAAGEGKPFARAALLQGALLLQRDYCTRGQCGRCPLS